MSEINTFTELDKLVIDARDFFHNNLDRSQKELEEIFDLCFEFFKSISKFYEPKDWENRKEEYALGVLIQSLETILAMYYLAESGFWTNSLSLMRNYVELFSIAIAIGYDNQCFIDWKNNRNNFREFHKILKRIEESNKVPDIEKKSLPMLKEYWNESSQIYSHNISLKSIRTFVNSGEIKFEPKKAKSRFQQKRLTTLRNMIFNVLSTLLGIFDYGSVTKSRKDEFPEAENLIKKFNKFLDDERWKKQKTA